VVGPSELPDSGTHHGVGGIPRLFEELPGAGDDWHFPRGRGRMLYLKLDPILTSAGYETAASAEA
jgi:hypothetical protein